MDKPFSHILAQVLKLRSVVFSDQPRKKHVTALIKNKEAKLLNVHGKK
jgi:hypothetical protein